MADHGDSHGEALDRNIHRGWPLQITRLEAMIVNLAMKKPFRVSFGVLHARATVIVRVETSDGRVGFGEAAPLPDPNFSAETPEISYQVIERYLAPSVIGRSFDSASDLVDAMAWVRGFPFAKTGIESACWHAAAVAAQSSLSTLFGGSKQSIPVGESLGIADTVKDLLAEVELRLSQGFQRIKLKVQPGWDVDVVRAVREHFGDIPLMIDANSAYTLDDAETFLRMEEYNLMMIEQPLAFDDVVDHAQLQAQLRTPICLDESIDSVAKARAALALGSCRIINIKPGRAGGPSAALTIHDLCLRAGVPVWMGGMFESGIGRAFNLALASLPGFSLPADMSPAAFYFERDLVFPSFVVDPDGTIQVPQNPGLGFSVDEEYIRAQALTCSDVRGQ